VSGARDERRHTPGPERWWCEWWHLDFARDDGFGGFVRLTLYPNEKRAWYWAYVVTPDAPGPIVVRDHEVALPRGDALEVRADGLWSECTCEVPFDHWTYGLEAFGVRLDDPIDALHGEIGERLPVGFDLEWEVPPSLPAGLDEAAFPHDWYEQPGTVHGEVLLGRERVELDSLGARSHGWGDEPFYGQLSLWSRAPFAAGTGRGGYVWRGDGRVAPIRSARAGWLTALDGTYPHELRVRINDVSATAELLRFVTIPLSEGLGGVERLDRVMCRFAVDGDDVPAFGWADYQPPPK
jgi:hypothetical protein